MCIVTGEGPLQCTSCPPHSMLDGGLCVECLGLQYYDSPTQLCKSCHKSCRSCSGPGPFSCLACMSPLHLDRMNNQCVPCCTSPSQLDCCHCDKATGNFITTREVYSASLRICLYVLCMRLCDVSIFVFKAIS
jgi:proprotein convertase subtilisin/kexin type 5